MPNQKGSRAQLMPAVSELLPVLTEAFTYLKSKSHENWYPHLTFERRISHEFVINPQGKHAKESDLQGVMLRVFDGRTLFEKALDQFDKETLRTKMDELVEEVQKRGVAEPNKPAYVSPSWTERLQADLEHELRVQIPKDAKATDWVHFGVPMREPLGAHSAEAMAYAETIFQNLTAFGDSLPMTEPARHPDVCSANLRMADLNFIFIDEQVRMSQALKRNAIFLTVIKGDDRGMVMRGGLGGQETVEVFQRDYTEAYDLLAKSLRAERLKPGRYKVLMSPSITGVFAHEAFGHSQEGDTWARGRSKAKELYAEKIRVGNEHATILNNPAIYTNGYEEFASWGSYYFDEEGWLAQKQELVKEGWLMPPMTNLTSAVRLNVPRTANGKRQAWTNGIYTRQTNTYFSEGKSTFTDLLSMVDYGFFASQCFGGMEDPKGMGIQVGMAFLEEIKDGKFTGRTFKGPNGGSAQMTGYVPDYLNSIIAKSKIEAFTSEADKAPHPWNEVGGCGKYHKEWVVAGCGGPFMLVDNVLLG